MLSRLNPTWRDISLRVVHFVRAFFARVVCEYKNDAKRVKISLQGNLYGEPGILRKERAVVSSLLLLCLLLSEVFAFFFRPFKALRT